MPRSRPLVIALVALVLVLPAAAEAQQRAASVLVERVEERAIADTTAVLGQLVASVEAEVAVRRAGVAAEVLFAIGDRVEAGQALVRLETNLTAIERESAEAALEVAKAGVEAASAALARTVQNLERQTRLRESLAFSQAQFEDLEQTVAEDRGQLARAVAQVRAAEAAIARVDYDLEHSVIRAPFSGIVTERMAQPGQYVDLGDAVARLLDGSGLEIEADVPVELVDGIAEGTIVALRAGRRTGEATVRVVLPVETISTRTRPVRFSIDLSGFERFDRAIGRSVSLDIPVSAPRSALTVPKDALVQGRGGGWIVYVVEDGEVAARDVTLGQAAADRLEVLSGLAAGELVVVRGNERLRPGQPVEAREAGG